MSNHQLRLQSSRQPGLTSRRQILFGITAATVGAYGWYQPHFWASVTGETRTSRIDGTEPWKDGAEGSTGKYRYQTRASPGRDAKVKDAPSALNSVIVPNVNLPRVRIIGILQADSRC
jgi:hypothetical protein